MIRFVHLISLGVLLLGCLAVLQSAFPHLSFARPLQQENYLEGIWEEGHICNGAPITLLVTTWADVYAFDGAPSIIGYDPKEHIGDFVRFWHPHYFKAVRCTSEYGNVTPIGYWDDSRIETLASPQPPQSPPIPAANKLYGQLTTVTVKTSGISAYFLPALIPCNSGAPLIVDGFLNESSEFVAFENPTIVPIESLETDLNVVNQKIVAWSGVEPIASCAAVNLPPPQPKPIFDVFMRNIAFQEPPRAFEPATLNIDLSAKGVNPSYRGYAVQVQATGDFPYGSIEFWFDGDDPSSQMFLTPSALSDGEIRASVSQLRFPQTYNGSITVTAIAKDPGKGRHRTSLIRTLQVDTSPLGYKHCVGAAVKLGSNLVKVPAHERIRFKLTAETFLAQQRLDACDSNLACQAHEMHNLNEKYFELGIQEMGGEALAALTPTGRTALFLKTLLDAGLDGAKCVDWIRTYEMRELFPIWQKATRFDRLEDERE